ncbi:hypothetical protein HMPREF0322_00653 [Desulfitobacterium hafniense DP7]|uniref:Uncharacterized protein n=1 Tax=Desulfitobacterium hafniense DP7 TaxID=537010 RepID=G9XI77_DESHA|nr:hypothetical protein HMPREF0322_00653 [Desulfitobacterium hafniense DP7]
MIIIIIILIEYTTPFFLCQGHSRGRAWKRSGLAALERIQNNLWP